MTPPHTPSSVDVMTDNDKKTIPAPGSTSIVLARRPSGRLVAADLEDRVVPRPEPGPGQILVRTLAAIVAPGQRAFMGGETFRAGLGLGETVPGEIVAVVTSTAEGGPDIGTVVTCFGGWAEYFAVPVASVHPVAVSPVPLIEQLGLLGPNGLAAYLGMIDVGRVSAGETVIVSAAAGAVGHYAGQIAKAAGARVVGITGSTEKNDVLVRDLGFDAALDRRSPSFEHDLAAACPDGVDVFFDSVGGSVLEAVLPQMNVFGRIVCCGSVSEYDGDEPRPGVAGVPMLVVTKRLTMQGFLVDDFGERRADALEALTSWYLAGVVTTRTTLVEGLLAAPAALIGNLAGRNVGQTIVRVIQDARLDA